MWQGGSLAKRIVTDEIWKVVEPLLSPSRPIEGRQARVVKLVARDLQRRDRRGTLRDGDDGETPVRTDMERILARLGLRDRM